MIISILQFQEWLNLIRIMQSKLILGTVQFGLPYGINNKNGFLTEEDVDKILQRAKILGIKTLDTAAAYGKAEKRIGAFHKNNQAFNVITKFSKKEGGNWETSLKNSLNNLNLKRVDTIMFHSFDTFLKNKEIITEILTENKGRLFNKLGVSVYTNQELSALKNVDEVDVIQLPFNLLDNEHQRSEILQELQSSGKEIHTRSCFLQGLFFMDDESLPKNLVALKPYLRKIKNIAEENKVEIGHLALQYVLNKNYIDGVLFGVDSIQQLEQNFNWSIKPLPAAIFIQIDKIEIQDTKLLNPSVW